MSEPAEVASLRRRLIGVFVVDAVCLVVAIGGIVGYLSFHIPWMGALFTAAMVAGFAAQIWLVIGFVRAPPPR